MNDRTTPTGWSTAGMVALLVIIGFVLLRIATNWADSTTTMVFVVAALIAFFFVWQLRGAAPANLSIPTPRFARTAFESPAGGVVWLALRLFLGTEWLSAGLHKLSDPAWMQTGEALRGYWERAVAIPETGRPAITYDWYRSFLQGLLDSGSHTWFAKLIAFGETAVGIALIIGLFVGIAAFFGATMNLAFLFAGSTSSNPLLLIIAILLMVAWKCAGYWGFDGYLLPMLGTPWAPGTVFHSDTPTRT